LPTNSFSTGEVVVRTGVTARQLQCWDEHRIVLPARQGRKRVYTLPHLIDIPVIEQQRQRRVSLVQVRKVLRLLRSNLAARWADLVSGPREFRLLLDRHRVYLETEPGWIVGLLRESRQPMLLICLTGAVEPVRAELRQSLAERGARKPAAKVRTRLNMRREERRQAAA
jgi:DNA-binding transcriptional MerR regulator